MRKRLICPKCEMDIMEYWGYVAWKHWKYCPECGVKLEEKDD
jgi:hypothetical protein